MSWNRGSHETITLLSECSHARSIIEQFWSRLAWVTRTPLGLVVEPDVYWIKPSGSALSGSCQVSPRIVRDRVVRQPLQAVELGGPGDDVRPRGDRRAAREQEPGARRPDDAPEARQGLVERRGRTRHRHRNGPGVEAAEERLHEVEAVRVQQQHPLAGTAACLEVRGDGAGPTIERGESDGHRWLVARAIASLQPDKPNLAAQ